MAASTTSQVYMDVIEDVMVKVRAEFNNNGGGPGEEILRELQANWESKMIQAGVFIDLDDLPPPYDAGIYIPQQDGSGDAASGDDTDESLLDENDDLDELDEGENEYAYNLVVAQFDKVKKTKGNCKWKCTFKDGIMQINNKDILFNKATGEFDFNSPKKESRDDF